MRAIWLLVAVIFMLWLLEMVWHPLAFAATVGLFVWWISLVGVRMWARHEERMSGVRRGR